MQYTGIHVPAITPFLGEADNFAIDEAAFRQTLQHLIDSGVDGIVIGGTTGEYYAMSSEERLKTIEIAREMTPKSMTLTAGIGALRTEDAIQYGLAAKKIGADCVLLGSPYYAMPDEEELTYHLTRVDRAVDMPVVLYNFPDRVGVNMTESVLSAVTRSGNVIAMKESSGDINRLHLIARNFKHIQLSCGMDDQALEFFAWGAKSWICGAGNFIPEAHIALYNACVIEKDFDKGRAIMSAMLPLLQILEQGGKFIQCIKYGCELKGLPSGHVRRPLRSLRTDKALKRQFAQVLSRCEAQIAEALNPANQTTGEK